MAWVQAGIAIVGLISSLMGGKKSSDAAGKAASSEMSAEGKVTQSKLLDLHKEEEVLRGQTIAATAGSNIKTGMGSALEILNEQAREFDRERFTVSQVGATKVAAAGARGHMVGQAAMYQGIGQAAGYAANAFSIIAASRAPAST